MSTRALALRHPRGKAEARKRAEDMVAQLKAQSPDWDVLTSRAGMWILLKRDPLDGALIVLPRQLGVVLGPLFRRSGARSLVREVDNKEAWALAEGGGAFMAREYWGSYCAILEDPGRDLLRGVRDPMGARPLYYADAGEIDAIFTHAEDWIAIADAEVDENYIETFLTHARHVGARSGIRNVDEILAGVECRLEREGAFFGASWSPEQPKRFGLADINEARDSLRETVLRAAASWRSVAPRIAHRLSGGLDSSVTLAALAQAGPEGIVAFNQRSIFPESDERAYARAMARACGVELVEFEVDPAKTDYSRLLDQELHGKPMLSSLSFAHAGFAEAARDFAGGLVTSGQGGDQIFHRSVTPLVVADAVRDGVPMRQVLRVAMDNARLARRPVWAGLAAGFSHGVLRRDFDGTRDRRAETPWLRAENDEALVNARAREAEHPWSKAPGESPARYDRRRRVMDLQYYHQPSSLNHAFQTALVLTAQPIVEVCLSIAPYVMNAGGVDRSLERAAFADLIPQIILQRRSKGDSTRYSARALERNRDWIGDVLLDGELVRRGLVSRPPLEAALARGLVIDGQTKTALLNCVVAEAWLRRFNLVKSRAQRMAATASAAGDMRD